MINQPIHPLCLTSCRVTAKLLILVANCFTARQPSECWFDTPSCIEHHFFRKSLMLPLFHCRDTPLCVTFRSLYITSCRFTLKTLIHRTYWNIACIYWLQDYVVWAVNVLTTIIMLIFIQSSNKIRFKHKPLIYLDFILYFV